MPISQYARGFCILTDTRGKLLEARYFLQQMIENQAERDAFKYNLSAFLSAARSVTLIMQKEFGNIRGFADWYGAQEEKMKADTKMRTMNTLRTMTIHQKPIRPHAHVCVSITEHIAFTDSVSVRIIHADGTVEQQNSIPPSPPPPAAPAETESTVEWRWYFDEIPDIEITTVCREHISKLESIVVECERLFGSS